MTKFDDDYITLVKEILSKGVEVENRTGVNTIKIPSYNLEFDLRREFPILQTKQTFYKNAIIEMLWIWQMQSNDVRELHKRGVHIWDEWMVDADGIYRIYEPVTTDYDSNKEVIVLDPLSVPVYNPNGELKPKVDDNGNIMTAKSLIDGKNIRAAKYFGKDYAYTIGTAYGYIVARYMFIQNLIYTLKNNKMDRRMVKSLWQDEFLRTAVLPSCVWSTEWDVTGDTLNLSVHQRSCYTALGLPFNVTQYATLLKMIAQVADLEAGTINYSIKDAHIYVNQIDGIEEQIARYKRYKELLYDYKNDFSKFKDYETALNFFVDTVDGIPDLEETQYIKNSRLDKKIIDIITSDDKPYLWLDNNVKDFFLFDNSRELKHSKVKSYKHMGKISFPITQ